MLRCPIRWSGVFYVFLTVAEELKYRVAYYLTSAGMW